CGKKIGPDPRNFNQRVSLGRNDLLIRTFPKPVSVLYPDRHYLSPKVRVFIDWFSEVLTMQNR
ncbi:hypothetical protein ACVTYB_25910, partial [Klebsiella pneumoniae subsp. pneumoniae]